MEIGHRRNAAVAADAEGNFLTSGCRRFRTIGYDALPNGPGSHATSTGFIKLLFTTLG
jgi:hypothetical protein